MATARDQRSLFGEILDWMLAPLLLLWPMSVTLTWFVAQNIANGPFDRELGQLVRSLAQEVSVELAGSASGGAAVRLARTAGLLLRSDDEDRVTFQVLGPRGELLAGDADLPVPPETGVPDSELRFRDDTLRDDEVRVAYLRVQVPTLGAPANATVQIAETLGKRSRLATEIIKGVILPQFAILPLAVLLVWLALARGIQPLADLQQRIRRRESHDLSPIAERDVPEEVAPLVRAINDLLQRLDASIARQRHFLTDAAHQLKTPLAGLRMQAEVTAREIRAGQRDPESIEHALRQIAIATQRAAHMVNQLLSMARAEAGDQALQTQPVDLAELTRETVLDFVPRSLERRIDLGYEGATPGVATTFQARPVLVRELVRNLVDNALQYTPGGGTVTARVTADPFARQVVLEVEDNGPGIPAAERELVFRPFYRTLGTNVEGTGLGLAIVKEIADHHGAQITISDTNSRSPPDGPGARFTVRFPLAPP
jgi:two-component system sensor histidine kinase TctE